MNFLWLGRTYGLQKKTLANTAKEAFLFLPETARSIEGKFVSEEEISRLNRVYRQHEGVTDVLSFLIEEKPVEGQIFICYTYAKKEAVKNSQPVESEIIRLLLHGILHLYGYDHRTAKDEQKMENIIKSIEERINV